MGKIRVKIVSRVKKKEKRKVKVFASDVINAYQPLLCQLPLHTQEYNVPLVCFKMMRCDKI